MYIDRVFYYINLNKLDKQPYNHELSSNKTVISYKTIKFLKSFNAGLLNWCLKLKTPKKFIMLCWLYEFVSMMLRSRF